MHESDVTIPVRSVLPDEPHPASPPAWNSLVTGMVTGIAVASVTGHWYFGLFSGITGVVTVASWAVRILRVRLHVRSWKAEVVEEQARFAHACHRYADRLAQRRRSEHPPLSEVRRHIVSGGAWFWQERSLRAVSIGSGLRGTQVVPNGSLIARADIPLVIDVSPGAVIGVHGGRAVHAAMAMIVRMAARVGPSDWQLATLAHRTELGDIFEDLPHVVDLSIAGSSSPVSSSRHTVLVVDDSSRIVRGSSIMRLYDSSTMTIIAIARDRADLPAMCSEFVDADDSEIDGIDAATCRSLCASIGRWIDPDHSVGALATHIGFLDLVPCGDVTPERISDHWRERRGRAPRMDIGVDVEGLVSLDLDRDGPHGVVIGTTGSGKSELLRQIVISMALNGSPHDVSFVLIDYKGGAAFDLCAGLPHVVGLITDLDSGIAERALHGLESEMTRRERVLRSVQVSEVSEYQRQYQGESVGAPHEPLPRLVIVIDELAALRTDVPDFVRALASIAQRGRSLGVHVIAASQRAAALGQDVLANSSIRIALRVHSVEDSREIVGTDRAAVIDHRMPGRMVVKIGGGTARDVQSAMVSDVAARVVSSIRAARGDGDRMPQLWLDPLPTVILRGVHRAGGCVGIVDDVHSRIRDVWRFIADRHLLIVGGSGRTNALHTIIRSLDDEIARTRDVVIVSCRAHGHTGFAHLDQHIDLTDHERLWNVMRMCDDMSTRRHADTLIERRLILVIDDLDVWRQLSITDRVLAALWDCFERILAAGESNGITCIATSAAETSIPMSIRTRMAHRWSGTRQPGVFHVDDRLRGQSATVQLFWEPPEDRVDWPVSSRLASALTALPHVLRRRGCGSEFAVLADGREAIEVRRGGPTRFIVIGQSGSGISTALAALTTSWVLAHADGLVIDLASEDGGDLHGVPDDGAVLIVVDEIHRHAQHAASIGRLLGDPAVASRLSVVAGSPPAFIRSMPDHWIHHVRRSRTGVLLGRSLEDCDLFGLHSPPVNVHPLCPGRGLWVDGGAAMGTVQFVIAADA